MVVISFEVPDKLPPELVHVSITSTEVIGGVRGETPMVSGTLHQSVCLSGCGWEHRARRGYGEVVITLAKAVAIEWSFPIKGDCGDGMTPMDGQSEYEIAKFHERCQDFDRSLHRIRKAADKGLTVAELHLGQIYQLGDTQQRYPVSHDPAAAVDLYLRAAVGGSSDALVLLGACHQEGGHLERDTALAVRYFERAVSEGQKGNDVILGRAGMPVQHRAAALFTLGMIHQYGDGNVGADPEAAVRWWTAAAEHNFAPAVFNLGVAYCKGFGVPADLSVARQHFQRAQRLNPNLQIPESVLDRGGEADTEGGRGGGDGGEGVRLAVPEDPQTPTRLLPRFSAGVDPEGTPLGYAASPHPPRKKDPDVAADALQEPSSKINVAVASVLVLCSILYMRYVSHTLA